MSFKHAEIKKRGNRTFDIEVTEPLATSATSNEHRTSFK